MSQKRRLAQLIPVLFVTLLATGCVVSVDDDFIDALGHPLVADLQVQWTIDHSDAASSCSAYGVESWVVKVRGPEDRDLVLNCRRHWWSSETDLYDMPLGDYRVTISARDAYDAPITSMTTTLDMHDGAQLETLGFNFVPRDFY